MLILAMVPIVQVWCPSFREPMRRQCSIRNKILRRLWLQNFLLSLAPGHEGGGGGGLEAVGAYRGLKPKATELGLGTHPFQLSAVFLVVDQPGVLLARQQR
jgi:hypothetical protein